MDLTTKSPKREVNGPQLYMLPTYIDLLVQR